MEKFFLFVFWCGIIVIVYTYVGYPILIYCLAKTRNLFGRRIPPPAESDLPALTIVIAAYNEERFIEEKIQNTLDLDYPSEKRKIIVVTDGSSDNTPEIAKKFSSVTVFHQDERRGKIHAVNRVMPLIVTPITVFSDANTLLNTVALKKLAQHYRDRSVGGVAGEKRIISKKNDNSAGSGEGLYWRYESFIKKSDSDFYSIVGAAGELFSIRTELFEPPSSEIIIEDFYISMQVAAKGYRFIYEPEAYAIESASATTRDEWKRKVRISAGGLQAVMKLLPLINPFRFGALTFQYISHRVLRWTLAPFSLLVIFFSGLWLAQQGNYLYRILFGLQMLFYAVAFLGYLQREKKISIKVFFVPFYFAMMNFAVYAGALRFFRGKQSVVWEKTNRAY